MRESGLEKGLPELFRARVLARYAGLRARREDDDLGGHLRRWRERARWNGEELSHVPAVLRPDGEAAPVLRAVLGAQTLRDLGLEHENHAGDAIVVRGEPRENRGA